MPPTFARGIHQDELDALVNAWTATLTVDEVDALMTEYSIPAGRVYRAPDMLADPHFSGARGGSSRSKRSSAGGSRCRTPFPKTLEKPPSHHPPPPPLPRRVRTMPRVYAERLGLDAAELARLAAAGII